MPLSNVNPNLYSQQLETKADRIKTQFVEFNPPALEIFDSPPLHFRARAEFRIWHQGDESFYAMFAKDNPKQPVRIDTFPIGLELINQLMKALMVEIKDDECLRHKLFQIEFLTTLSGEALITLVYHKALNEEWQEKARTLAQQLNIHIIGRSKKQKIVLSQDYVEEILIVNGKEYSFQQIENSFTQPNAIVNQKMLGWALEKSQQFDGDLLELYCGNGNFTTVVAENFERVLATEISKTSVKSAKHNFDNNTVSNVEVVRMSSEEISSAIAGERDFRRLQGINLKDYQFSTILVDPPRAGLDPHTESMAGQFNNIIYISCNPDTLYNNMKQLSQTHRIEHFAIFDQFPYTDHIECGVILKKN